MINIFGIIELKYSTTFPLLDSVSSAPGGASCEPGIDRIRESSWQKKQNHFRQNKEKHNLLQ